MKKRCISFIRKSIIAVFCTFTAFSHCLFGYASNDDEYFTFNTYEAMQAYSYFSLYGFSADLSNTYTDTYVTTGSINLGNVNISLSSSGSTYGSGTAVSDFEGMFHSFVGTGEDTYTLDISQANIASVNPTNTTPSHLTLACTFNTTSGGYLTGGTCSDSSFTDIGRYNVSLNAADDVVTITGSRADTYAVFRTSQDPNYDSETSSDLRMYSADSFTGSLSFNSSGGLSGSGTISMNTTTTNTNRLNYVLPYMSLGNLYNPNISSDNTKFRYYLFADNPFVIAYASETYVDDVFNFGVGVVSQNSQFMAKWLYDRIVSPHTELYGGLNIIAVETNSSKNPSHIGEQLVNILYPNQFTGRLIPLYVGYKSNMSDSMYRFLYGSDRLIEAISNQTNIIENGNNNSQQKEQALNTQTTQMQNKMNQFQNIEDTAGDNMNSALNNINTNPSLLSNNKFLVSADWIRQQFNRIVTNTPFEAVITFCLVFGLGLLLLGKVR